MTTFSSKNPFHSEPFRLTVNLGVQSLCQVCGVEKTEIPTLRSIGAPGVVQSDLMKQEEITQEGVPVGAGKIVSRGSDEENLRPLSINGNLYLNAGDLFDLIDRKVYG